MTISSAGSLKTKGSRGSRTQVPNNGQAEVLSLVCVDAETVRVEPDMYPGAARGNITGANPVIPEAPPLVVGMVADDRSLDQIPHRRNLLVRGEKLLLLVPVHTERIRLGRGPK